MLVPIVLQMISSDMAVSINRGHQYRPRITTFMGTTKRYPAFLGKPHIMHAGAKSTSSSAGLFRAQAQQTGQRKPSNLVQPSVHVPSKGANTEAEGGESSN